MSVVAHNGRQEPVHRKQLSDQLDRFDSILDGLANGLNEAMADAAREGTRQAVKDAIIEILANPELRAAIQSGTPQPVPAPIVSTGTAWEKVKGLLRQARAAVAEVVHRTKSSVGKKVKRVGDCLTGVGRVMVAAWRLKRAVITTAVVGLAAGVGAYYLLPHAGAVFAAAAGAFVSVTVRTAVWVRTALRPFLPAC